MKRLSIRYAGPILLLLPVVVAVVALWLVASWQGRRSAERLSDRVMNQAAGRIEATVNGYLANAVLVTRQVQLDIAAGDLDVNQLRDWRMPLYRQVNANTEINSVAFGNARGAATWVIRYPGETQLEYAILEDPAGSDLVEYQLDAGGAVGTQIGAYPFSPQARPWYQAAVEADEPTWSRPYAWVRGGGRAATLGIAYARPIKNDAGEIVGVLDSDISLRDVSRFLANARAFDSGAAILAGADGNLIGVSSNADVIDAQGERIAAVDSVDPLVAAVAQRIGSFAEIDRPHTFDVQSRSQNYRVDVRPLENPWGLDWRLAVVAPEVEILSGVAAMRRQAWWIGGAVVLLALGLGAFAAFSVVRPVAGIAAAVHKIGDGHLDDVVRVDDFAEFVQLSDELNRMTAALKDRLRLRHSLSLAMEIQQRLLPSESPRVAGLDVAGHSNFCDETGGDYFDFIELSPTDSDELVVVVGDVMGHGIAAALLMATARGILRSRAGDEDSLGRWLTHINRLLVEDTGGERFMTMALLVCDPRRRRIRLASAGHDLPLLYDPTQDQFLDLPDVSGLPLGLVSEEEYEEGKESGFGAGSLLLVGTDGLWESQNSAGEAYGKDRIREIIRTNATRSAEEIACAITDGLARFRGAAKQDDDITFTIVKFTD